MPFRLTEGELARRHPGTVGHLEDLQSEHLPMNLRVVAEQYEELAHGLVSLLEDGPRLTTALHLLVQSKDAAVRQRVADLKKRGVGPLINHPEPELRG